METQEQYDGRQGIFGFEIAGGNDYLNVIRDGNFVIPKELQDKNKELSVQRLQEVAFMLRKDNRTTRYICTTLPGLNSDGEPNRQVSISWE